MQAIAEVQQLVDRALDALPVRKEPRALYDAVGFTPALPAKRLRPVLLLMMNRLVGGRDEDALGTAVAIELLHTFTLVHDDIMDEAPLRRGQPTVWSQHGTDTAILAGDLTLVMAYASLSTADPDRLPALLSLFDRAAQEVCEGQQMDMTFTARPEITMASYLQMIGLKTAALIAGSVCLGVQVTTQPDGVLAAARRFGHDLGMAFQIQDDILDVYGDEATMGKSVGGDLLMQKKSFLVVAAREAAQGDERIALDRLLSDRTRSLDAIRERFVQLQVRAAAESKRDLYFESAMKHLAEVPGSVVVRAELADYCAQLLNRTY